MYHLTPETLIRIEDVHGQSIIPWGYLRFMMSSDEADNANLYLPLRGTYVWERSEFDNASLIHPNAITEVE